MNVKVDVSNEAADSMANAVVIQLRARCAGKFTPSKLDASWRPNLTARDCPWPPTHVRQPLSVLDSRCADQNCLDESPGRQSPNCGICSYPNLYAAIATTIQQNGQTVDGFHAVAHLNFGIRTIKFDPTAGFFLNGQHVKINGVCDHADLGPLGSVVNVRGLERQIQILKEMGCNAIRTSHNMPAPELLDLCDKMGMLVMDESFDTWERNKSPNDYGKIFADWHTADIRAEVRRDRNHPSIILWSVGNEIGDQGSAIGNQILFELTKDRPRRGCHAHDVYQQ